MCQNMTLFCPVRLQDDFLLVIRPEVRRIDVIPVTLVFHEKFFRPFLDLFDLLAIPGFKDRRVFKPDGQCLGQFIPL